jgi:hypothetical protein
MGILLPRRFELGLGFALFPSPDIGTAEGVYLIIPPNSEMHSAVEGGSKR